MPRAARRIVAIALLLSASAAYGRGQRIVLEGVDSGDCSTEGVTALFAEVELAGELVVAPASDYHLVLDGTASANKAVAAVPFAAGETPLHVALVIQNNLAYLPHSSTLRRALLSLLAKLPPRAEVSLLHYDARPYAVVAQGTVAQASAALAKLPSSNAVGHPALIAALRRAEELLQASSGRRLIVLVSDGLNADPSRDAFKGFLAKASHSPIYAIAFSPADERSSLLHLGELAKQSRGTFRWARQAAQLTPTAEALATQLGQQWQMRFAVADGCAKEHRVQVSHGTLRSNSVATPAVMRPAHDRASTPWIIASLGLLSLLATWLVARRLFGQRSQADNAAASGTWTVIRLTADTASGGKATAHPVTVPQGCSRIGAAADCLIRAEANLGVAAYHAELTLTAQGLQIRDLASPSGTTVDGDRVAQMKLHDGAIVCLGQLRLTVHLG